MAGNLSSRPAKHASRDRAPLRPAALVSFVVVSTGDRADLLRAMAIVAEAASVGCEVIVVRARPVPDDMRSLVVRSGAMLVQTPDGTDVARLREIGIAEASGDVVMIREDRHIVDRSWINRVVPGDPPREIAVPMVVVTEQRRVAGGQPLVTPVTPAPERLS